ncbi:MAG: hypothetical protein MUF53_00785 [Gemmatimonadaceae bacterium]|nr:hypothetical protein [Gemmatimonadaceae bacterium]
MTRWPRLALGCTALLVAGLACRDAVGPGARAVRAASLSIAAPVADLVAPDGSRLEVDNGVVRITRADGTVALERTFAFPAGQQNVELTLDIPLNQPTESFTAGIRLLNGTTLLFQTSGPITVSFGSDNPSPTLPAPVYAGPGTTVTALSLAPRDTILTFGDSVRFRSTAVAGQQAVQAYFVNLTTNDAQVTVGTNGFVRAPTRRATIQVRGTVFGTQVADATSLTFVPRPTVVTRTAGDAQTGTVGTALPQPISVTVTAADGLGVANVPVTFSTSAPGGAVTTGVVRTDANGVASTTVTLGTVAGAQQFVANVAGLAPATFTQTASAGALAALAFPTPPPATVRAQAPFDLVVQGRDAFGNAATLPSPVTVAFGARPGTATLVGTTSVAPSGATATFTGLRASRPGTGGTLVATAGATSATSPSFTVTVGALATVTLVEGAAPTSALAGTTLPDSLVWRAVDDLGVPLAGQTMTFTLTPAAGNLVRTSGVTDTAGRASPGAWTLSAAAGSNVLTAAIGVVQAAGVFVTGTAGAPAAVAISVGDAQTATVSTAVAVAPRVRVTDAGGNPVAGVGVTFAVGLGGGSITGPTAVTDAAGLASVGSWTLGTVAGANTLTATVGALPPVTFTAVATVGAPASLQIVAPAGGTQAGSTGQPVPTPPSVRVRDAFANVVPGVTVTFAVATGGGTVTGATPVTDANGIATVGSWTLGATAGTNTLTATVGSLTATFTATTEPLIATTLVVLSGDAPRVRAGQPLRQPVVVQARTSTGVPVPNTRIFYAVIDENGDQIAGLGGNLFTDASGNATVAPFVPSTTPGFYSLGLLSDQAARTVFIDVTGEPVSLLPSLTTTQTVAAGALLPGSLSVEAFDENGRLVPDAPVVFTRSAPNAAPPTDQIVGTVTIRRTTDLGVALIGGNAPSVPGRYLVRASVGGARDAVFVLDVTGPAAGAERVLAIAGGDGATLAAGATLTTPPSVVVRDALGGVVAGATVTFTRFNPGGGSAVAGTAVSDANGVATLAGAFTLSATPGLTLIEASSAGAASVTFSAFGWGTPVLLAGTRSATLPDATVGDSFSPIVQLLDENGIGIAGVILTVTNTQPGATGSPVTLPVRTVVTDAAGRATLSFPIGSTAGLNAMTFAFGNLTFTYTARGVTP